MICVLLECDFVYAQDFNCTIVARCDSRGDCIDICRPGSVVLDEWYVAAWTTQNDLAKLTTPCTAQLLGTHNSAITRSDGYGTANDRYTKFMEDMKLTPSLVRTHNQLVSLTDQLNMGVRMLELDVHWVADALRIAHCGGFQSRVLTGFVVAIESVAKTYGVDINWDMATVGCEPSLSAIPVKDQRRFDSAVSEVADWVTAHPNEFVILYLDNNEDLDDWHKVTSLVQTVERLLGTVLYRPCMLNADNQWPTIRTILQNGYRVAVFSRTDYGEAMAETLFAKPCCDWHEPRPSTLQPNCTADGVVTGIQLVRPVGSDIVYGPLNNDGQLAPNNHVLHAAELGAWAQCGGIPSPDLLTPELGRSGIWSWREGVTVSGLNWKQLVVVQSVRDGRWLPLSPLLRTGLSARACRVVSGRVLWIISVMSTCPVGSIWSVPVNGKENAMLWQASQDAGVCDWVLLNVADV